MKKKELSTVGRMRKKNGPEEITVSPDPKHSDLTRRHAMSDGDSIVSSNSDQYREFLQRKQQLDGDFGFAPLWMPDFLFDFQKHLVEWACRKGRGAIFADCGMGKTIMQLVWAENVVRKTNKPVLILTPLAVAIQTAREASTFGIECRRSSQGENVGKGITVTNYERLHHFDCNQFGGVVCDESSILKNFDGSTKAAVTEFMRTIPYRLLCTATAAPNDYFELGTSSEALGYLGYQDMLGRFFKEADAKDYLGWGRKTYRFRGHAEEPFWRWVCSWARACRKPSDLGYDDRGMVLPPLIENEIVVEMTKAREGYLFPLPAQDLREERQDRRETLEERCNAARDVVEAHDGPSVVWCHLNPEGDMLEDIIKGAEQVSGSMDEREKEERLIAFASGELKVLVTKPKIGCWGLNWQHCSNVVTFASHSWEQYYQAVRRCWRFGQRNPVTVSVVATEGEVGVLANLRRKADAADRMFEALCRNMKNELAIDHKRVFTTKEEVPSWLSKNK